MALLLKILFSYRLLMKYYYIYILDNEEKRQLIIVKEDKEFLSKWNLFDSE